MKKTILILVVMLLAVSPLFAGPQPEPVEEEAQGQFEGVVDVDHSEGWSIGSQGGQFVRSTFGSDPRSFNVVIAAETSTTDITNLMYSSVVRRNQLTLEWETSLAESYEISEDQQSITFTLQQGTLWSDGEEVTAEDFVDAVNRIYLNEEIETNARDALFVGGEPSVWTQIDDYTFRVDLPDVYAGIYQLSGITPLPMHIMGPILEEEGAAGINQLWGVDTDVTQVVGNGPFVIGSYEPGQRVTMVRNENYWESDDAGNQLPYLDSWVYTILPDQDTQLQRFLAGELDFYGVRGEDYAVLVDQKEELGFEIYNIGPAASTQFITFNQNPIEGEGDNGIEEPQLTWLSNRTFRQAMAHLIDRQTIINNIAFGFGYPQYSFVPRFSPYYWDGADDAAFQYDPQAAEDLLDSIDFVDRDGDGVREDPDGNPISLTLATNSGNRVREQIAELFAQEAAAVGIEITANPIDFNVLVGQLLDSYDWEMILIGLTGSVDPISGANVYPSSGNLHMIEPLQESPRRDWERQVDEAWIVANNTTEEADRIRGFQTIQEIWIEEVPWAYTFNAAVMHAYKTQWANIYPHPIDGYGVGGVLTRIYNQD